MKISKIKLYTLKLALLAAALLCLPLCPARGQIYQFGQPTYLLFTTNSQVLATTVYNVYVPPLSLQIQATNALTVITNTINNTITVNGTNNLTVGMTFVYNAATMGTNFSTNWPGYFLAVTNYTYGQAIPQSGGTNTAYIK